MNNFLTVFSVVLWVLLVVTLSFYLVLAIAVSKKTLLNSQKFVDERTDLSSSQKENFMKSLEIARRTSRLARCNVMCVAGILFFILDVVRAEINQHPIVDSNFYFSLSIGCALLSVFDYYRYRQMTVWI